MKNSLLLVLITCVVVVFYSFKGDPTGDGKSADVLFVGGRVLDPETGLDVVANVAVSDGRIVYVGSDTRAASRTIDASGLIVAPGFIDIHSHAINELGQRLQVADGVTTALELEAGAYPVGQLETLFPAGALINYGASAGHIWIRQSILEGAEQLSVTAQRKVVDGEKATRRGATFSAHASAAELEAMTALLSAQLDEGAFGIGLLLDYITQAMSADELEVIFTVAAKYAAPLFIHIQRGLPGDISGLRDIIALAQKHGATVHVCHINANAMGEVDAFLAMIEQARAQGVQVTTEAYPYNAGSTQIGAAVFGRNWQEIFDISYEDVEWAATGERFNEAMWQEYRAKYPEGQIIHHYGKEPWTRQAILAPGVIIASDAMPVFNLEEKVHPRGVGTFARFLARYGFAQGESEDTLALLAKITLLPAQLLEKSAPQFGRKGRIQEGMDADITVIDLKTLSDRATYREPFLTSVGLPYVLVNGVLVIDQGELVESAKPGVKLNQVVRH